MGKKKEVEESAGPSAPAWMVTYGDMMTLLLCFFVLLLSFSSVQDSDFNKAMGSLQGYLGVLVSPNLSLHIETLNSDNVVKNNNSQSMKDKADQEDKMEETYLKMLAQDLQQAADNKGIGGSIDIAKMYNTLRIRLGSNVVFEQGKLEVSEEAREILEPVVALVRDIPYLVSIEGHTDNVPVYSEEYDSNWELSSARALAVLHYFVQNGVEATRMTAVACGENNPIADNKTPEGRMENRRVELLIRVNNRETNKGE